jgi:hypothetical protein
MKAAVSAICTMGRDGRKFPPLYVLCATSANARAELSPVPRARITVSENEWMTETVMLRYLMWPTLALGSRPLALVFDNFPGHLTRRIRTRAKELGAQMIEVPKGMTDSLQPLDRSCFGALKRMSEQRWDEETARHPEKEGSHAEGAKLLEETCQRVTKHTVRQFWDFDSELRAEEEEGGGYAEETAEEHEEPEEPKEDGPWRSEPDGTDEEPPSDPTREARTDRIRPLRARRLPLTRYPEVQASFYDLPLDPSPEVIQEELQEEA